MIATGLMLSLGLLFVGVPAQSNLSKVVPGFATQVVHADPDSSADSSDQSSSIGAFAQVVQDVADANNDSDSVSKYGSLGDNSMAGNQWSRLASGNNLFGQANKSSFTLTYLPLVNASGSDSKTKLAQGKAAVYGMMMGQMGFDHSVTAGLIPDALNRLGRFLGGSLILLAYGMNKLVYWLFSGVVTFADYFNPIAWLTGQNGGGSSDVGTLNMGSVHATFHDIYNAVTSIGMIGMTLAFAVMLGLAIMGWRVSTMSPRTGTGGGIFGGALRILVKMAGMFILPLALAFLYGMMLNSVKTAFDPADDSATTYAIYSNLIDYRDWVEHSRMGLPSNLSVKIPYSADAGDVPIPSHKDVLIMNADGAGLASANEALASAKSGIGSTMTSGKASSQMQTPINVVMSWMMGDGYKASDWASYVQAKMVGLNTNTSSSKFKTTMVTALEGENQGSDKSGRHTYLQNGTIDVGNPGSYYKSASAAPTNSSTFKLAPESDGGLSTVGMYNYLSSEFTSVGMTWTSSTSLLNSISTPEHKAVGLTGRGAVSLGNFALMFALVFSVAIIGLMFVMYAISTLVLSVPKILGYGMASGLGSIVYMIKLTMAVAAVLIEVAGSAILYTVARQILIGVAGFSDNLFSDANSGFSIGHFLSHAVGGGAHGAGVVAAASSLTRGAGDFGVALLLVWLAFKLIKARGPILSVFTKMLEDTLNTIFGTFDRGTGGSVPGSAMMAPGGAGLFSTNSAGGNTFNTMGNGMGLEGPNEGQGSSFTGMSGGAGDMSRGAQSRRSRLGNPQTMAGKLYNASQARQDALDAAEGRKGKPLTKAEKAGVGAKYLAGRAAAGALDTLGRFDSSPALRKIANDVRGIQDNSIDNGLRAKEENAQEANKLRGIGDNTDVANAGQNTTTTDGDTQTFADMADDAAAMGMADAAEVAGDVDKADAIRDSDADNAGLTDTMASVDANGKPIKDGQIADDVANGFNDQGQPLDADGDAIATNGVDDQGNLLGANGEPIKDSDGNTITGADAIQAGAEPQLDANKNPETTKSGQPVPQISNANTAAHAAKMRTPLLPDGRPDLASKYHLGEHARADAPAAERTQAVQATNQQVKSAMAEKRSADVALKTLPPSVDRQSPQYQAAVARQQQSGLKLQGARKRAALIQSMKPAPTNMLQPKIAEAVQNVKGTNQPVPSNVPTAQQARQTLLAIGRTQEQILEAGRSGDDDALKTYRGRFQTQVQRANKLGFDSKVFDSPKTISRAYDQLNGNLNDALNGRMDDIGL